MLIRNDEVEKRLNNPANLMNRLRGITTSQNGSNDRVRNSAMSLFIRPSGNKQETNQSRLGSEVSHSDKTFVNPFSKPTNNLPAAPSQPIEAELVSGDNKKESHPKTDDLIENADSRIKLSQVHNDALDAMGSLITRVKNDADNVSVKSIPALVTTLSKVVTEIRKEQLEEKKINKGTEVHHHFYMPEQRKLDSYEIASTEA